ncbi:MAG: hypothetical protein H6513_02865 [Acidimicrobiaceae bacterium]|nr:hypothetical protein [Ilumatobacter sp.]MCB9379616.1 hypothetical protein [Acidimicrobiaceae bacterium]
MTEAGIEGTPDEPEGSGDVPDAPAPQAIPWHGRLWIAAFVTLLVAANVGNIIMAKLLPDHPGALLALSARNRHLVLTVPTDLHWTAWAAIGAARLALSAVVCHLLGRAYGDRALRWFWRYLGMPPEQVAKFEDGFARAEWVVVPFFVGSNIVWVLSGASRTTWMRLAPLAAVGIAARLALIRWLSSEFESQLRSVIDFTTKYQLWFILGGIVVVVLTQVRNFRSGR